MEDEDSQSLIATEERPLVPVSHDPNLPCRELDLADVRSLVALFAQVSDPRNRRGVRHRSATVLTLLTVKESGRGTSATGRSATVLTLLTLAALCGAGNFRQSADRIVELPQPVLAAAGARRHPVLGFWRTPRKDTIRRLVEAIDAETCDQLVCQWLAARIEPGYGIGLATDGKTARGSGDTPDGQVVLFSATRHDQAIVLAQVAVPPGTTEVTQVKRLLADIDLTGLVVTADAAHPSPDTATYISPTPGPVRVHRQVQQTRSAGSHRPTPTRRDHGPRRPHRIRASRRAHRAPPGVNRPRRRDRRARRGLGVPDPPGRVRPRRHPGQQTDRPRRDEPARRVRRDDRLVHERTLGIENKTHWVRDVLLAEDRHRAFLGDVAQTMAAIRNLALGLIRLAGHTRIKQVLERNHADKTAVLALLATSQP